MSSIDINKVLKMRKRRLEVEKIPASDFKSLGDYTVVQSNGWLGIRAANGQKLLEPIYDDADVMNDISMCIVRVKDVHLLYNLADRCFVEMPDINSYQRHGYMLEVNTDDGTGLFSCRTKQMLVPPLFLETTHADNGRYLWVKTTADEFAFYDILTAAIVKCPENTRECFDSQGDLMFIEVDNKLHCLDETGHYDPDKLRRKALQGIGRIRVTNYNRHISVISDIYGNIIN